MFLTLVLALAARPEPHVASCAWVRAENDGAGAGFVVDARNRLLVTCRHIVADQKTVEVFFPWHRDGALVTDRREYLRNRAALRAGRLIVTGTVRKTSDDLDLALVELDALPPGTRAVTLSAHAPQAGTRLSVIGHRLDLDTLWNVSRGPLRVGGALSDGYFWRGKKLASGANALVAQLPTEEGDSGGPAFDPSGDVVGMVCALRRACPLAAVLIPARAIRSFLDAPEAPTGAAEPVPVADTLVRATVWVKPTATDTHLAGVLIEKDLVLTSSRGLSAADRVGVALPLQDGDRWAAERDRYRDPLALHLAGAWRGGTVLACDGARDLALVRLDSGSDRMVPLALANRLPGAGAPLHAMSHPGGLEFAWVYASGSVRQRGRVALEPGEQAPTVDALVCQLPTQAGSPGGPIVNARGELVGVLASREGAQQVGYAATSDEIRRFLDAARRDRPAATLAGLLARLEAVPAAQAAVLATAYGKRAEAHRAAGRLAQAERDCTTALWLDPDCAEAHLCRAARAEPEAALAELDAAVERGPFHRDVLVRRAALALVANDFRKARGDAERVLAVRPADAAAREALARAHLGLGDDARAATALGDMTRADPTRTRTAADVILWHADALEAKFPGTPGSAADWLARALSAVQNGTRSPGTRTALADALRGARGAGSDTARLELLRAAARNLR